MCLGVKLILTMDSRRKPLPFAKVLVLRRSECVYQGDGHWRWERGDQIIVNANVCKGLADGALGS
jgi:hypothetical protein